MTSQKVTDLSAYKNRDSQELVEYLAKRSAVGDLRGLFVVSVGRDGQTKAHATGTCKRDMSPVIGTVLSATMKSSGTDNDPTSH